MISAISLKGFQSHVNTTFNLQDGLNVITGPSDSGKTAIIRAIRWVAFNEPQGETFVNESVGEAEVKIILHNGSVITKHRRKGKTTYVVQANESDEGSIFEKSEVPLEVTRLLGIEKHSFGDFEAALNLSFQLDAPFLISETASAGAKVLGKLAGTESVDLAIKGVSKDTHAARNMRSQAEKDIERILGSLFEYQHVDDAKQSLETAEMIFEQVEKDYERLSALKEYRHQYSLGQEKINNFQETIHRLQELSLYIKIVDQVEKNQQRFRKLLQLQDDGNRLKSRISSLEHELRNYIHIQEASALVDVVQTNYESHLIIVSLRQSYQKYTDDVKRSDETLEKTKRTKTLNDIINSIQNTRKKYLLLDNLFKQHKTANEKLVILDNKLVSFQGINAAGKSLSNTEKVIEQLLILNDLQEHFTHASYSVRNTLKQSKLVVERFNNAKEELRKAWDEAGGVCPLCESVVCEHDGS